MWENVQIGLGGIFMWLRLGYGPLVGFGGGVPEGCWGPTWEPVRSDVW